ncbi:salt-stress induced hydrophobic peptide [Richelia intracellularis]|nr:salt-stress induced hydrophobic peptide [Richelia intracellularis]
MLSLRRRENDIFVDISKKAMDLVRIICAIFLPPLGVFLQVGLGADFWINLLLTIFGFYILGIVHAVWVIAKK